MSGAGSRVLVALRVPASPERTFEAFTEEIALWWRPNVLFQFTERQTGRLSFELGPEGRLIETYPDGEVFEIGRIQSWDPPHRLEFGWSQASFTPDQATMVQVHFEPVGDETRVTVQHFGWDALPVEHRARHSIPLATFQLRHGQWWQELLRSLTAHVSD